MGPQGLQGPPGTSGSATTTPTTTTAATADPYDDPSIPLTWVSIKPNPAVFGTEETVVLKVPPGALIELTPIYQTFSGGRNFRSAQAKPANQVAPASGDVTFKFTPVVNTNLPGEGQVEVKVTKAGTTTAITVTHPLTYNNP